MLSDPGLRTVRYGAVVLFGFGIDFGLTLALSQQIALPLELSAAIGFLAAVVFNYVLFEFWVFGGDGSAFSATRVLRTALAAMTALGVRVGVIWLVAGMLGITLPAVLATITLGAAASASVNFLLLRLVFGLPRSPSCSVIQRRKTDR